MNRHVKKAMIFIGLTFLVNWSLALLFFALGGHWYTPVGMVAGAFYMFVPMAKTPIGVLGLALLGGLIAGVTINAVAGFGEELGWRGLLQRELAFLGFWRSSVLMMTVWCMLLAPIFSYIRVKAQSVIAAA